jgi:hypothetical protein
MHEARYRTIRHNPRKPAYCETGRRPYLRRTSGLGDVDHESDIAGPARCPLSFNAVAALATPEAVVTPLVAKDLSDFKGKEGVVILVEYPRGFGPDPE